MTVPDQATDTELLLNAYVDGELDAASALAFDRRVAAEPELAAARDRMLALRSLLRANLPREVASDSLRQAMAAQAGALTIGPAQAGEMAVGPAQTGARVSVFPERRTASRARPWASDWRMALAACLVGAVFGAGVTDLAMNARAPAPAMAEVVADHLRAVMAPQPFDVASSDQHTVKPWFTGRLTFAPRVFDLAPAGFTLIGGRVDVLGGQPAAALVFRHDKHLISLLSQPVEAAASVGGSSTDRGFQIRAWTIDGMRYWAVSDVAPDELDAFEAAAKSELGREG